MSGFADTESVIPGIFKRREGNYGFRANVAGGKGKQTKVSGFPTQAAAYRARIAYLGGQEIRSGETVAIWFDEFMRSRVLRETTYANYRYTFSLLEPSLGDVALTDLAEADLRRAYAGLVSAGFSTSTIRSAHDRLKTALKMAVREAKVARNCAENVLPPKGKDAKATDIWTFDQLQCFARYVSAERDRAMWGIWMTTGLRRGELCGLKWSKVNFETNELRIDWQRTLTMTGEIVEGEVKTKKANRVVTPPGSVMSGLKEWQLAQPPSEYAFTSRYHHPYYPGSFEKRLKALARRAGLPEISPHDLRHTFGTRAVENGMEIKLLSTLMGHARVETTLNLYVHPNTDAAHLATEDLATKMFR